MKIYNLGSTYPPTGKGVGILLIILGLMPCTTLLTGGDNYLKLFLLLLLTFPITLLGFWFLYAKSKLIVGDENPIHHLIESKAFLFFNFKKKVYLADYELGVLKKMNIIYIAKQGIGAGMSAAEGKYRESYFALNLKKKKVYEFNMVFKGSENQVMDFVKNHLLDSHLVFFHGAIHPEKHILFKEKQK